MSKSNVQRNMSFYMRGTLFINVIALLLVLLQGGCGPVIGFTADLLPRPSVPAQYDMRGKNILIWIDDMAAGVNRPQLRHKLNDDIASILQEHHAIAGAVDYRSISLFRQHNPDYASMTIQQLGQEFKVDKVVYIFVNSFTFRHESGEGFYRVSLAGYVKVVDVQTGQRVWPSEQMCRPFDIIGQLQSGQGAIFESKLVDDFARQAAEQLALLFYKHKK